MSKQITHVNSPWTSLSQENNIFLIHEVLYKQPNAWQNDFAMPSLDDRALRMFGSVLTKSSLSQDIEAIFTRFKTKRAGKSIHPLTSLAEEAIASMKNRTRDPEWSKRISKQMTAATD